MFSFNFILPNHLSRSHDKNNFSKRYLRVLKFLKRSFLLHTLFSLLSPMPFVMMTSPPFKLVVNKHAPSSVRPSESYQWIHNKNLFFSFSKYFFIHACVCHIFFSYLLAEDLHGDVVQNLHKFSRWMILTKKKLIFIQKHTKQNHERNVRVMFLKKSNLIKFV